MELPPSSYYCELPPLSSNDYYCELPPPSSNDYYCELPPSSSNDYYCELAPSSSNDYDQWTFEEVNNCIELPPSSSNNYNDQWTFEEEKCFELCIAMDYLDVADESTRWQEISNQLGGFRTKEEVALHYEELLLDIELIETDRVMFPSEWVSDSVATESGSDHQESSEWDSCDPLSNKKKKRKDKGKGIRQWSVDEHRLFLIGLKLYNKGDWRSISRTMLNSRTAGQVASHAQKFFNHRKPGSRPRKRKSIHDITEFTEDEVYDLYQRGCITKSVIELLEAKGAFSCVPDNDSRMINQSFDEGGEELIHNPLNIRFDEGGEELINNPRSDEGGEELINNPLNIHDSINIWDSNSILQ